MLSEETLHREIACLRRDVARHRRTAGAGTVDLDEQLEAVRGRTLVVHLRFFAH
jgi:hypothetical protein